MWWGPGQDPGGAEDAGSSQPPPNQELQDLQDQFEHQQVLIAQLKEMLRKNELTTAAQERVEECANTLNKISARPKRGKPRTENKDSGSTTTESKSDGRKKIPIASEKINLLKQQLEETKAKIAERDRSKREIGEMVTQLNTQLDISQQANSQASFNISTLDDTLDMSLYSSHSTPEDLYSALQIKDKHITELTSRVSQLEANIIDLQENVKEKDSVIDARTKAITLMTESLSKKGKNTLDMLDDTKEQMRKMQENFVTLETEMKAERDRLMEDLRIRNCEVASLAETNMELERSQMNLQERIDSQNDLLEKYKTDLFEFEEKIAELSKLNEDLSESTLKTSETAESSAKTSEEHEKQTAELQNKVKELESKLKQKQSSKSAQNSDAEIEKLKKQLDESNKNSIKFKAQSKAKLKELQKKVDAFKNISDTNAELLKLHNANEKLIQKIAVIEEEKGNLQLQVVESDSAAKTSGHEDLQTKTEELTAELQNRDSEILKLNTDVAAFEERIKSLNEKVFVLENAEKMTSEITKMHLEEHLESLDREKGELLLENQEYSETIEQLRKEKLDIVAKLETYMQENIELIDKLEKLSAEKVSSAESIEIVENLTQQEKLELEAYNKNIAFVPEAVKTSDDNLSQTMELNDSVNELTEETSELMAKIELFTEERREVMEKMDALTTENSELTAKIREIENNRDVLVETYELLQNEKETLENEIVDLKKENSEFKQKIDELNSSISEMTIKMEKVNEESQKEEEVVQKSPQRQTKGKNKGIEKEIQQYKRLIEKQKQEISSLQGKLLHTEELKSQNEKLELLNKEMMESSVKVTAEKDTLSANYENVQDQLMKMQDQYQKLVIENERLEKEMKTKGEMISEKTSIEQELRSAKFKAEDVEKNLLSSLQEIEDYQTILEENKNELIASADTINRLQTNLDEKQKEIEHLNSVVSELNKSISNLEFESNQNATQNETLNEMVSQLSDLKLVFNENMAQLQFYETEVEENSRIIENQKQQLRELTERVHETETLLHSKNEEIDKLKKELENNGKLMDEFEQESAEKEQNFQRVCKDLKEKYITLAKQIDKNSGSLDDIKGPLEEKIKQLEATCAEKDAKNKEQVEKMKKLAANLKKKVAAHQELEAKYNDFKEKYESEQKEKGSEEDKRVVENQSKIAELLTQLSEVEQELSKYKTAETMKDDKLREEMEEMRNTHEIVQNATQMKIQEHESVIESLEAELVHYKQRVDKLEEGLSHIEERRLSLERKAIQLGTELEEKSTMCKEVCETEDLLEKRLAALTAHDELVEKRLEEAVSDNQQLTASLSSLQQTNESLRHQLNSISHNLTEHNEYEEKLVRLENENAQLNNSISHMKKVKEDLRKKLDDKITDFDTLEMELTAQLEELNNERKSLLERCEHVQETYNLYTEEIEQYKKQVETLEIYLEEKESHIQLLTEGNWFVKNENEILKEKLTDSELDPSNIEIMKLQDVINQKNQEIEHYQRQNMQLQMQLPAVSAPQETTIDLFADDQLEDSNKTHENEEEISSLKEEIHVLNQKLCDIENELDLHKKLHLESVAKNEVDDVISRACETISLNLPMQQQALLLTNEEKFNKSHVFDLSNKLQTEEAVVEVSRSVPLNAEANLSPSNSKEELLQKIKTLEFMFYTMEKEKEDALMQCQHLTDEITSLVYDKEKHKQRKTVDFASLEGQILSDDEATVMTPKIHKKMVDLEYSDTKIISQLHSDGQPIVEDVIKPKSAYLCYDSDDDQPQKKQPKSVKFDPASVEGQILQDEAAAVVTPEMRQEMAKLEYSPTKQIDQLHTEGRPIVEDVIKPKTAYLCYDPDDTENQQSQEQQKKEPKLVKFDSFIENDDGWVWGPEEAKLEEEHRQQLAASCPQSEKKVEELESKVHSLEEEMKKLQVKSAKLIKKLKELKIKNDSLTAELKKSAGSDFPDLDDAIQEELKMQVNALEKRLKELRTEHEKEKAEKENILKRVDVLTAANERLVENKEKQDVEVQLWQQRNRELSSKLEQFEWENDGFTMQTTEKLKVEQSAVATGSSQEVNENMIRLNEKVEELNNTITELTLDNEELQAMLEEQRKIRLESEKNKTVLPANTISDIEHSKVVNERDGLKEQLLTLNGELKKLTLSMEELEHEKITNQKLIDEQNIAMGKVSQEIETLRMENGQFSAQIQDYVLAYNNYSSSILTLQEEKGILETTIEEHLITIAKLNTLHAEVSTQKESLNSELINLRQEKDQINSSLQEATGELGKLQLQLQEKQQEIDSLAQFASTDNKLQEELELKNKELNELRERISLEEIEFNNKLTVTVEQLAQEWANRVDQRGSDVAESWKLHVEARENEFVQLESQLRNEIVELEEKCNGLVNENNELRKNVDTEIRNEVDRIAALQQQINDKERVIKDLTVQFHDKERIIKDLTVQFHEQRTYLEQQGTILQDLQTQVQEKDNCLAEKESCITEKDKLVEERKVELDNKTQLIKSLETKVQELQETAEALNSRLSNDTVDSNKYTEAISNLNKELADKVNIIETLTNEKQALSEEIEKLNNTWQENHKKTLEEHQLEYDRITNSWQQHLQTKEQEIELLKQTIEETKCLEEDNLSPLASMQQEISTQLQTIENLNQQLQENQWQIYSSVSTIESLQQQINEKQETINYLQSELDKNMNQMETLNNDLISYQQNNEALQSKDTEINRLTTLITEKDREHSCALDEREKELKNSITEKSQELEQLKNRLAETDDRYEELLSAKDSDLDNLRVQLQDSVRKYDVLFGERESEMEDFSIELEAKKIEYFAYESKINALEEGLAQAKIQVQDLEKIIEDQVLKIEELKDELYNKSRDYDALIAELDVPQQDPYQMDEQHQQRPQSVEKRVHFAQEPTSIEATAAVDDASEPVSRAELDLALYMLHQRDVRCEELTVELMQLLEERDTLQLRLSNAIREKEDIALRLSPKKTSAVGASDATSSSSVPSTTTTTTSSTGAVPKSKAILLGATGTELATEVTEHFQHDSKETKEELKNKLSQLRSVRYNRDVTIRDDQEARHMQQLSLMQQHRDVAAMLPPEAAARLVDANYTLSRDVQSPSKVLLNWLWGRSTPKVNNV